MNEKFIEGLSQQFSSIVNNLPKGAEMPGQEQLKSLLQNALSKLDLVTRDEFDAQSAVLQRTRQKVDALEAKLEHLSKIIEEKEPLND
jgi:BMFP domain-containing protein YqiC